MLVFRCARLVLSVDLQPTCRVLQFGPQGWGCCCPLQEDFMRAWAPGCWFRHFEVSSVEGLLAPRPKVSSKRFSWLLSGGLCSLLSSSCMAALGPGYRLRSDRIGSRFGLDGVSAVGKRSLWKDDAGLKVHLDSAVNLRNGFYLCLLGSVASLSWCNRETHICIYIHTHNTHIHTCICVYIYMLHIIYIYR